MESLTDYLMSIGTIFCWDNLLLNFKQIQADTDFGICLQLDSRHVKDNKLLNDVFPERIAKQLREGLAVEPENYDCVTVFFSDIVGFTDISRQLAPADVMKMLNRLYSEFDAVTRKHGLFKV